MFIKNPVGGWLNCSGESCFLTNCWNASRYAATVVVRVLGPMVIPVESDGAEVIIWNRQKRDFGITAEIVAAIAIAAGAAVGTGIALSSNIQTAQTLRELSGRVQMCCFLRVIFSLIFILLF